MQTLIQDIPTNYYTSPDFQVEKNIKKSLFLHGRGQNGLSFSHIAKQIEQKGEQRISIDLPGFGKTPKPKETRGIEEYTSFIQEFITKKQLTDFDIIAHSFGCRVSLLLSLQLSETSDFNISHQYLFGPAGVEKTVNPVRKLIGKIAKKTFSLAGLRTIGNKLKKKLGGSDYNLAGEMRDILVKIVNKDLTPVLHKINIPTIIVRGDQDDQILRWQIDVMEKNIPNCKLNIVSGADHFVHTNFDFSIFL